MQIYITVLHCAAQWSMAGYSCTACGRSFTRKSSAIRHINKLEDGGTEVLPNGVYQAQLTAGMIPPPVPPPTYTKKLDGGLDNGDLDIIKKAFEKRIDKLLDRVIDRALDRTGFVSNVEKYYGLLLEREEEMDKAGREAWKHQLTSAREEMLDELLPSRPKPARKKFVLRPVKKAREESADELSKP